MRALDIFQGLGGWSDGLAKEGFEVLGIEIDPEIAEMCKHPTIVEDVKRFSGWEYQGQFDLIVGSPPCRDFTRLPDKGHTPWANPKNPIRGYELVWHFIRIVNEIQPRFWLMENVSGLADYLEEKGLPPGKPRCRARISRTMIRCFWGNFPPFLVPKDMLKQNIWDVQGKYRKWERAKIPLPVARALGKAIKSALQPTTPLIAGITNHSEKEGSE